MPTKKIKMFRSQFDEKAVIADDSIAVTLIRSDNKEFGVLPPEHAILAIEEVKNNQYSVFLTDLVNPYTHCENIKAVTGSHLGHGDQTHVRRLDIHNKPVRYSEKSHTWVVSRDKADLMLKEIQDEIEGKKELPEFYLMGGKSLMTYFTNYQRHGKPARNCIHWALDKLRLTGINLFQGPFNFKTATADYTANDNKYHLNPYGMHELCDFIKLGKIEAIRRFFPPTDPNVDINQLVSGDVGSVEFQLRNYNPLMLACGYGKWDIAKMLINEYHADVNVQTKCGFTFNFFKQWFFLSYNALDCTEKNKFGLTQIAKEDNVGRQEVMNLIKEKMQQQEPLQNLNVQLP